MLRGTTREHVTQSRDYFWASWPASMICRESPGAPLHDTVACGVEPLIILGAMWEGNPAFGNQVQIFVPHGGHPLQRPKNLCGGATPMQNGPESLELPFSFLCLTT
jgi:hypothetical protein